MKSLSAKILIGTIVLTGALPAAGQSLVRQGSSAVTQPATNTTHYQTTDRETYTQQVRGDMRTWEQKLQTFDDNAATKGSEAGNAATMALKRAWASARSASRKLESVSDRGWQEAKLSYERASHDLDATWHKVHPENT